MFCLQELTSKGDGPLGHPRVYINLVRTSSHMSPLT